MYNLDLMKMEQFAGPATILLKALSNERRLRIICALYEGEKSVSELEPIVGLRQSALSQHLARLRQDRIVETRRSAQTIYYSLSDTPITAILHTLCDIYCKKKPGLSSG